MYKITIGFRERGQETEEVVFHDFLKTEDAGDAARKTAMLMGLPEDTVNHARFTWFEHRGDRPMTIIMHQHQGEERPRERPKVLVRLVEE